MTSRIARRTSAPLRFLAALVVVAGVLPAATQAQDTRFPGVELGLMYEGGYVPYVAVKSFSGRFGGLAVAPQVGGIIGRDLRFSDRYNVMDSIPSALVGGEAIDYRLWDQIGADWMVSGSVEGAGDGGFVAVVELHDVVYGEVKERGQFRLPNPQNQPAFRMAAHRISDQVVQWISGEPGMAATRIAFAMRQSDGTKEIYLIDSDGENRTRLTRTNDIALSPAWSPTGDRLLYQTWVDGDDQIQEIEIASGRTKTLPALRDGMVITPSYHPDGNVVAFAVDGGSRSGIYTYDFTQECCLVNLTEGRQSDLSPGFSPDGREIVFQSNRFGERVPQIMRMSSRGSEPDLVSPYRFGEQGYYTSPDWSPRGDAIAFHGRINRFGMFQILVAQVGNDATVLQLTSEGNNEDPSWAPDGRHLAFVGVRSYGTGLFIVDSVTGRIRSLVTGVEVSTPDWSPSLPGGS